MDVAWEEVDGEGVLPLPASGHGDGLVPGAHSLLGQEEHPLHLVLLRV